MDAPLRDLRWRGQRGSLLIAALLLGIVILLVGLGFLAQRRAQYQAAAEGSAATQALALAQAGLEDFRVKMAKSYDFPAWRPEQTLFSYSEDFPGGSYSVRVQRVLGNAALNPRPTLYVVRSEGTAGDRGEPRARRVLQAEILRPSTSFSTLVDLGSL